MPQLPPLASAIVTITGVVLAVFRLLTASRPFWSKLPVWLQKGLPAALVALGTVPAALQLARSWLDVAVALVVAGGTWFTASRGDKRPPRGPSPDDTARINPLLLLLVAGLALHQQACSSVAPPVAKSLPCDDAKMTRIDLAYVAEVAAQCREYPSKHECPAWPSLRAKHRAALRNECPQ